MSPTVAPEACAGKFFPLSCFFLTEGRRVLWVTQPLHAERCHSFFLLDCFSLCPSLEREQALRMSTRGFSLETGLMDVLRLSLQETLVL